MKKFAPLLALLGVMLFSVGCTKTPETPVKSIDNNTSVVVNSIDNNATDTNSTDIIAVVANDGNQSNSDSTDIIAIIANDGNQSNSNSSDIVTVVNNDNNQSNSDTTGIIAPMDDIVVISENSTTNPIDTLISKIKNKKLTSSEERKVYTSFNSVSNTYPITINGVKIESYDRTLKYDHINGRNLTACTRTKDVTMTSNNKTKKFRVCQTTNYNWIVK